MQLLLSKGSDCGGSEGSNDEESDFGEHFDMESLGVEVFTESGGQKFRLKNWTCDVVHFIWPCRSTLFPEEIRIMAMSSIQQTYDNSPPRAVENSAP